MKTWNAALLVVSLVLTTALAETKKEITVESMAPSVVKTVPECGDMKVNPKLKEIVVTFSKDMADGSWSVCQMSKEHYPELRSDVYYKNDRTFVFPVKLEPDQTYVVRFNWGRFNNFKDEDGRSAVPYQLVFKTKDK